MTEEEKNFVQAFEDRCKLYSKLLNEKQEREAEEILDNLKQKVWQVNLLNMQRNFETNVRFLSKYPFLLNKNFVAPEKNRYLLFIVNADVAFRFDQEDKKFERVEINSIRETKYFFKELDKPLLLESEYNQHNLRFLSDTVRDSRDYGGDNHIYIKYEGMNEFSLLMYYVNMYEICGSGKF